MNLHEYQSKRIFAQHGIPIPHGEVAMTPSEVRDIAVRMGKPVVVKSQVLVGGRGKAGGIKLADDSRGRGGRGRRRSSAWTSRATL